MGTDVVLGCGEGEGVAVGGVVGAGDGDEALLVFTTAVVTAAAATAPPAIAAVAPAPPAAAPPAAPAALVIPSEPALAGAPSSLNGVNIDCETPVTDAVTAPAAAAVATSDCPAARVKTWPLTSVTCTGSDGVLNA